MVPEMCDVTGIIDFAGDRLEFAPLLVPNRQRELDHLQSNVFLRLTGNQVVGPAEGEFGGVVEQVLQFGTEDFFERQFKVAVCQIGADEFAQPQLAPLRSPSA